MKNNIDSCSSANNAVIAHPLQGVLPCVYWAMLSVKEKTEKFIADELSRQGLDGLSPSHAGIMMFLFASGGKMQMKDITEKLRRTKSTVSELVSKLESHGLARRCECTVDGRACYVGLIEKGSEMEKQLRSAFNKATQVMLKNFSEEDKARFSEMLGLVSRNLD